MIRSVACGLAGVFVLSGKLITTLCYTKHAVSFIFTDVLCNVRDRIISRLLKFKTHKKSAYVRKTLKTLNLVSIVFLLTVVWPYRQYQGHYFKLRHIQRGGTINKPIFFIYSNVYDSIYILIPWNCIVWKYWEDWYYNPHACVSSDSGGLANHITVLMKRPFELGSLGRKAGC